MSLALCHLLTQGLIYALQKSASEDQKSFYIPKLASGHWTGTMNLTEPQSGTDLSTIKTKAIKDNGHYKICLLYTSPSPRDALTSRMTSSA